MCAVERNRRATLKIDTIHVEMENVPAMSGINERAAARIMKDVLGEASCKTDVLANIVPQLRNGNGVESCRLLQQL